MLQIAQDGKLLASPIRFKLSAATASEVEADFAALQNDGKVPACLYCANVFTEGAVMKCVTCAQSVHQGTQLSRLTPSIRLHAHH